MYVMSYMFDNMFIGKWVLALTTATFLPPVKTSGNIQRAFQNFRLQGKSIRGGILILTLKSNWILGKLIPLKLYFLK